MLVMKFGGTSVGDAACLRRVADIVIQTRNERPGPAPVVVVSAMCGVTDALIRIADQAKAPSPDYHADVYVTVGQLSKKHLYTLAESLDEGNNRDEILRNAAPAIRRILGIARRACFKLADPEYADHTAELRDQVAACGEKLSALLLAAILLQRGYASEAVFADDKLLITDTSFGAAQPLIDEAYPRLNSRLAPMAQSGAIPVVTGYIGSTAGGRTTTLGRGGSDYSASLVGAALSCSEIWIWTDVDGIMTADPKVVPAARPLDSISYSEAAQLSRFGAKVIHPRTVLPAVERNIPILIKNTFNTAFPGTAITAHSPVEDNGTMVKGITSITSRRLREALDDSSWLPDPVIEGHIGNNGYVAPADSAVITAVGVGLPQRGEVLEQLHDTLARHQIQILTLKRDPEQRNMAICFIVPQDQERAAVRTLHDVLIQSKV